MIAITYEDMVKRHGSAMAYDLLLTVERLAAINNELNLADEETRFQRALETINKLNFASEQ